MIKSTDSSTSLAVDANGLNGLRLAAKQNAPDATRKAATQFEGMFLNMMMKSMRDASPQDGITDSEQSKMFTSMLDQQLTQNMATRGVGLADVLVRQLSAHNGAANAGQSTGTSTTQDTSTSSSAVSGVNSHGTGHVRAKAQSDMAKAFQDKLGQHAEQASQATGIPAKFILGQAALESGWGKREIKAADGSASHNLFGIKATGNWKGKVVTAATTEYTNGVPHTKMEKFRAYDSYADAFSDYANLLSKNPRYGQVLANSHDATSFAKGLQRAGYATDPHYADKIANIINKSFV
jgi:flagellar protein FlgJ